MIGSSQRVTEIHVEVQVFRVLVATKIREDPAGTVFGFDICGDFTNDGENLVHGCFVELSEIRERRNMCLRNDDNMNGPERHRVMEGQHVIGLRDDVDRRTTAEGLFAIEIVSHGGRATPRGLRVSAS